MIQNLIKSIKINLALSLLITFGLTNLIEIFYLIIVMNFRYSQKLTLRFKFILFIIYIGKFNKNLKYKLIHKI